jgi:sigma-E factor negative regulatory protein RseB
MFTDLKVMDKPTPEMIKAVTLDEETRRGLMQSKQRIVPVNDMPWRITQMPKGFSLTEHYQHINGKRSPVDQLVLTDGMATVSVFVENMSDGNASFKGMSHMGAVNAFGTVLGDHQLTVVGEVPAATVRLIGHSVSYVQAER